MDRNHHERILRAVLGAFLIAGLGSFAACGGGGGSSAPPPPASGSVVWSQTNNPSDIQDQPFGMAVSGASMYIVGYDSNTPLGDDQWRIEKRNLSDGTLDTVFGSGTGSVVSNPSGTTFNSSDVAYALAIDSNYMYIVGYDDMQSDTDDEWRIEKRYLVSGETVTAFGTDGYIVSNPNSGDGASDQAFAVAVDSSPTGTIYIVGYESPVGKGTEWRVEARDKATGTVVSSITSSISIGDDMANAIAVDDAEGYMYLAGSDSTSSDMGWRIEKRKLSDLSLDLATFGTSTTQGYWYNDPSPGTGFDEPFALALDANYMYIVGYDSTELSPQWRIEKRDRATGALAEGFGSGGVVHSASGTDGAGAYAIAIDSSYMYVGGFEIISGNARWRLEKRSLSSGALATSFGNSGVVVSDVNTGEDSITGVAVDPSSNNIYIAGYDQIMPLVVNENFKWRIMKLVK